MFPLEKLCLFCADELQLLLCGDQAPTWSREDLLRHTEPKNGYTRDSPGYQMFLDVAAAMSPDERKVIVVKSLSVLYYSFLLYVEFYSFCDWEFIFAARWFGKFTP